MEVFKTYEDAKFVVGAELSFISYSKSTSAEDEFHIARVKISEVMPKRITIEEKDGNKRVFSKSVVGTIGFQKLFVFTEDTESATDFLWKTLIAEQVQVVERAEKNLQNLVSAKIIINNLEVK